MSFNQTLRISIVSLLLCVSITSYVRANDSDNINSLKTETPLYLPINREQFPALISAFEEALKVASISSPSLSNIKVTTTDYWHPYQQGIRQGRPGIYFAAPHFASWLIHKHQFNITLKLSGKLHYVIAARRSDLSIFEINDLANKTVCTDIAMDLSFLLVNQPMKHNRLSAKTKQVSEVASEMKNNNVDCDAFSLSEPLFLTLAEKNPFHFIRLQQSEQFSNYAYLVHPSLSQTTQQALKRFLTSNQTTKILQPMHRLFTEKGTLSKATVNDYPRSYIRSLEPYWGP